MHMKVSRDQFEMRDERIVHVPTGAVCWKGAENVVQCDWGIAGQPLPAGDDYDREDVQDTAQEILTLTRARPLG